MTIAANILVVDDEPAILELCRRSLETPERHIVTAETGKEALSLFQTGDYAVVVTDLLMPGELDGQALFREIKNRAPGTDVIIMTGYPALDTAIPSLKEGAFDYLMKPFDQERLRTAVDQCIDKGRRSTNLDNEQKMRQDLMAAYAQLHEIEQLKEAFMARVNHELRSPLAPLLMAIDELRALSTDPKSLPLFESLDEGLHRLQRGIEKVLLFSDLTKARYTCSKKNVNMRQLLETVVARHSVLWEQKQLTVDVVWPPDAETQFCDSFLIDTAFNQLFLNAVGFNRTRGKIQIQARPIGPQIEISFADKGIGIPESKMSRIFDSFYQVADYLTRQADGLGLGLALVKRIARLHGGQIRVESQEGEGSVFTLSLPAGPASGATV